MNLGLHLRALAPAELTSLLVVQSNGEAMKEVALKVAKSCPPPQNPPARRPYKTVVSLEGLEVVLKNPA